MPEPTPIFFGHTKEQLFGWLHPASAGTGENVGLVICNPFGFEEVCSHRSLGHLANAAATAGFPTLRFDYAGCGNSSGDEFDPQTLARWIGSIHEAMDALKRSSGVQNIYLLGLRLGATLASLAAIDRDDVAGLIAVAPVVQGRLYIRELKILDQASAIDRPPSATGQALLEAGGFILTHETSEAIAAVDLRALPKLPAPRVLIVPRDDFPTSGDWATTLERLGASVNSENWPGYRDMMTDPQRAATPSLIISGVISALQAWQSESATPSMATARAQDGCYASRQSGLLEPLPIYETAVQIETGTSKLFGILTTCTQWNGNPTTKNGAGIVMLNSGSVHHVGPNRLWVRLARHWASQGVTVLRLDLSGIGDSPPRPGAAENVVYSAEAQQDIAAALQYIRNHIGEGECHLMGLCSGAFHALKAAVAGQRLTSALVINPLTFFWVLGTPLDDGIKDYEVVELSSTYRRQIFSSAPWLKLLRGQLDIKFALQIAVRRIWNNVKPYFQAMARVARIPFREDLATELVAATRYGTLLQFVFAAGDPGAELLRRQSGKTLKQLIARQQVSLDFVPDADHTFTRLDARERLVATLDKLMFPRGVVHAGLRGEK